MMVIDFTPVLYLLGWGLVLLLVVAGGHRSPTLSNDGRKARTWVETGDFVLVLRSNGVGQRGSPRARRPGVERVARLCRRERF